MIKESQGLKKGQTNLKVYQIFHEAVNVWFINYDHLYKKYVLPLPE